MQLCPRHGQPRLGHGDYPVRVGHARYYTQNFYTRRGGGGAGRTLIGYRGTINFDWYRNELTVHHHHSNKVEHHRFEEAGDGHHGGDMELARDFLAVITGTGTSRAPLEAGLLSVEMCLMARDSCRSGAFQEAGARATLPQAADAERYRIVWWTRLAD